MKETTLTKIHQKLGAKMVPFAGYLMPVQYEGVNIEHKTVREAVGVFDVSHMGEFQVEGKNALALLQKITTNDVAKLTIGDAQYSCFTNETGGIVDDLLVYRIKEKTYLLVVNAANIEKDWNWIVKHNRKFNTSIKNLSNEYSLLAIQGPKAVEAIQSLTSVNLVDIPYYTFKIADFADTKNVIISATGYTGSGGFEIYCKNDEVEKIWNAIFEAGKNVGIKPIGLAARDTLRLEMGFSLYGNDIDDSTSPIEAGLGWIVKFSKEFINHETLAIQKQEKPLRKLVGFTMNERGIPRKDYDIVNDAGELIGKVTSGTMSPSLEKGIGLGYITIKNASYGSTIFIQIRKKQIPATIVKLPFYKK